ncbi:MAG: methyltransferase [Candidatus Dojkabacteria bacterium]|jgi:tRNA G10  N-methylase Trm11
MEYKLKFLEGCKEFVKEELVKKFPNIKIVKECSDSIVFISDVKDMDEFRILGSGLSITDIDKKNINLARRKWRKSFVAAGIDPSLAYIMCKIGAVGKNSIILDPFCGSSTIGIIAIKEFFAKRVICLDISGKAIKASKENFELADIDSSKYILFESDVCKVRLNKQNVDLIISNLPFGIRVGNHDENVRSYKCLEELARKVLRRKGQLILLTQEKKLLREVFTKDFWSVKSVLKVNEGGLLPEVFVIERIEVV